MADKSELWVIYYRHEHDHARPYFYGDYDSEAEALAAINGVEGLDLKPGKKPQPHIQVDERHYYLARVL